MFRCWKYRKLLSAYVDNFLSMAEWEAVREHVEACPACAEQTQQWKSFRKSLRQVPPPPVPADLAFRIRTRLSQERGQQQQPGWVWRWMNQSKPYALPVASGALVALLVFAVLIPTLDAPARAGSDDVPLALRTPPRLRSSWPIEISPAGENLVVKLLIDERGRVADYGIVSGKYTAEEIRTLQNLLLFAVFDPATLFGMPTSDTVILPLRNLREKG
ncbi:MAG: zf-HC2 domain-containing protein [Acidobacteria bacterium]|nr:zf-HC2 domain-containing protein [Acidobacteriota bacterium]